ncbi:hypothetical protein [Amycolatopsis sp. NPDC051903]|uniref:hypothetical protein n=1 Tax=Amycolatopsis sp. NPDC051903 TaxID=3363936 RepID=UPI0037A5C6BD
MLYLVAAVAAGATTLSARRLWCLLRLIAAAVVRLVEQQQAVRLAKAVLESERGEGEWMVRAGGLDVLIKRYHRRGVGRE